MPTFEATTRFWRDFSDLTPAQRAAFRQAIARFVADLSRRKFRGSLRVKGIRGGPGVFEMTWAQNGRATFQFGDPVRTGEPHVVWRRVGTHEIFERP
jgi:hypothetical protein